MQFSSWLWCWVWVDRIIWWIWRRAMIWVARINTNNTQLLSGQTQNVNRLKLKRSEVQLVSLGVEEQLYRIVLLPHAILKHWTHRVRTDVELRRIQIQSKSNDSSIHPNRYRLKQFERRITSATNSNLLPLGNGWVGQLCPKWTGGAFAADWGWRLPPDGTGALPMSKDVEARCSSRNMEKATSSSSVNVWTLGNMSPAPFIRSTPLKSTLVQYRASIMIITCNEPNGGGAIIVCSQSLVISGEKRTVVEEHVCDVANIPRDELIEITTHVKI